MTVYFHTRLFTWLEFWASKVGKNLKHLFIKEYIVWVIPFTEPIALINGDVPNVSLITSNSWQSAKYVKNLVIKRQSQIRWHHKNRKKSLESHVRISPVNISTLWVETLAKSARRNCFQSRKMMKILERVEWSKKRKTLVFVAVVVFRTILQTTTALTVTKSLWLSEFGINLKSQWERQEKRNSDMEWLNLVQNAGRHFES